MKKTIIICLAFASFFACKEAPKNNIPSDKPVDIGSDQILPNAGISPNTDISPNADMAAITDVVHNFYKWYATTDDKLDYVDSKGKISKLDNAKLAAYHAKFMSNGFVSKVYVDNDVAYLKKCEADWLKNKDNGSEEPLPGLDFDRVFCGQDWDIKDYTTGAIKAEGLGTSQVKTTVGASNLELVKENGKWLIAKIVCK